jgi:hypothetical protein
MDAIAIDLCPQPGVVNGFGDKIDLDPDHGGDAIFNSEKAERPEPPDYIVIDVGRQIDIGVRALIAARDRPEQRQPLDAERAKLGLVRLQAGEGGWGVHGTVFTRV